MTELLLVRHGETDWNAESRWQGHADPPLNERGRAQARALADRLDDFDVVYASDLARARETAEILAGRLGIPIEVDTRLRERNFGSWEGLTTSEVESRFPDAFAAWRGNGGHGADDAESYGDFAGRVSAFVEDVIERHPRERVLVVAHGGSIRVILALAQGLDFVTEHASIPSLANCSLSRCAVRDGKLARVD